MGESEPRSVERLKDHYFNTSKQPSFLGILLHNFGWSMFSITIIELVPINKLRVLTLPPEGTYVGLGRLVFYHIYAFIKYSYECEALVQIPEIFL